MEKSFKTGDVVVLNGSAKSKNPEMTVKEYAEGFVGIVKCTYYSMQTGVFITDDFHEQQLVLIKKGVI